MEETHHSSKRKKTEASKLNFEGKDEVRNRRFAVSFDRGKSSKLKVALFGPVMQLTDPMQIVSPHTLYLPKWNFEIVYRDRHASILITQTENEGEEEITIKSKNIQAVESFFSAMTDHCDRYAGFTYGNLRKRAQISFEDSLHPGVVAMTNQSRF